CGDGCEIARAGGIHETEVSDSCRRHHRSAQLRGFAQQDEKLGKLSFSTSCDPKVQAEFERGLANIHSDWFIYGRRTFEGVLQQDPSCAIAYWGIALDFLGNTLATTPTRAEAEAGWAALEKAHAVGAKTQRERDWIEALSSYYRDHDKTPANARL